LVGRQGIQFAKQLAASTEIHFYNSWNKKTLAEMATQILVENFYQNDVSGG